MTTAYSQPSNRRPGLVALVAMFAILVAFAGGILLRPAPAAYAKAPPAGPADQIQISTAPTGTILVKKVGNVAGGSFTGTVKGITDPSFSTGWGAIAVGGHDFVTGLVAALGGTQYRVTESSPLPSGWSLIGYKEMPQGSTLETACPTNYNEYSNAASGASSTVYQSGPGNERVVCVMNSYLPPAVAVAHIMVRKVRDTSGGPADATQFQGDISGPTDTTWGPIGINGQTGLIAVIPGSYTVSEDAAGGGWSLVGYQLLSSDTQNCSTNKADYSMVMGNTTFSLTSAQMKVVCVMNFRSTLQLQWTLGICKVVDDNGDQVDDGGLFKIDLTWNQQIQMTVSLTVHESDGPNGKCEYVHPPFDILAKAKEQGYRPNGWNGDVAGYPKVKVDNGPLVSGDEATVTSGPNHVIVFHNETQPRPRTGTITVTKTTLFNGLNNPADDGSWHMTIKSAQCQVMQTKDTVQGNPVGVVSFTNLPICNDYVVSEDVNSKLFYVPVGPDSVSGVTPSASTLVEFVNDREFHLPCIFGCGPDTTPTPTNTPTDTPPAGTPTATSTPTDVVHGEKTPGAQVTPIPPSTGSGVTSIVTGHSMVATFGLLGLLVGLVVFGAAAMAMRKRA